MKNVMRHKFIAGGESARSVQAEERWKIPLDSFRRARVLTAALMILTLVTFNGRAAAQCDQCLHPRVVLYDCDVKVPPPAAQDSIMYWWVLSWPAAYARSQIMNNDPTKDCMTFFDGAVINAQALQGDTLRYGAGFANLPPAGPVESADYILLSSVTGSGGSYELTLELQTGESRETVKSVTVPFSLDAENQRSAGAAAASAFMPLFQTIRNFEVNKRSNDVTVAIRDMWGSGPDNGISVKPQKSKVDTGETIEVSIEMIDCDGVALSNRQVFFTDTTIYGIDMPGTVGGKVEPEIVTTDQDGRATVRFTAKGEKGFAYIKAWYPHKKPCGRPDAFGGSSVVAITEPPPDLWLLDARISDQRESMVDTSWSTSLGSLGWKGGYHSNSTTIGTAHVLAIVPNSADTVGEFVFDADWGDYVDVWGSGSSSDNSFWRHDDNEWGPTGSTIEGSEVRSINYAGNYIPGTASVTFYYTKNQKSMSAGISCARHGEDDTRHFGPPPEGGADRWVDYDYVVDDEAGVGGGGSSDYSWCTFTKSDSGFTGECALNETIHDEQAYGPETVNHSLTMTVKVQPYSATLTGIEKKTVSRQPSEFLLSQNYPNPFNPTTAIRYRLSAAGEVTLRIFDVLGREVATLVNGRESAGEHSVTFDAGNLPSGVYFYRLTAGNRTATRKLLLLK